MWEGVANFSKDDFLRALPEVKQLAFKKSTIKSAISHKRISPFDPNKVIEKRMHNYYYNGVELSPSTHQLWKIQSKGALSATYLYETQSVQLDTIIKRGQKQTAYPKTKSRLTFTGMITQEEGSRQFEEKLEEEACILRKRKDRVEAQQVKEDQAILNKQWREADKKAADELRNERNRIDREVIDGNRRM